MIIAARLDALGAQLIDQARRLAEARARTRRNPDRGWRDARLVWPLFTGE